MTNPTTNDRASVIQRLTAAMVADGCEATYARGFAETHIRIVTLPPSTDVALLESERGTRSLTDPESLATFVQALGLEHDLPSKSPTARTQAPAVVPSHHAGVAGAF